MAQAVGPLVDTVLARVFDPGAAGTSRVIVRDLFSRCQALLNGAIASILNTVTLTIQPRQQVYAFTDIAADMIRVVGVRYGARDLARIPFSKMSQINYDWFGRVGPRLESFAEIGRNLLLVHPMLQAADSVSVVYVQRPPLLTQDSDPVLLADDEIPMLTRMVEALLRIRQRDFGGMKELMEEMQSQLKVLQDGERI